jgi:hypothetical protein
MQATELSQPPQTRGRPSNRRPDPAEAKDWAAPAPSYFEPANESAEAVAASKKAKWRYDVNRFALSEYVGGKSPKEAIEQTAARFGVALQPSAIWRMLERALTVDASTGQPSGYWACVPNWRPSAASAPALNKVHLLSALFAEYPRIEAAMCKFVHTRTTGPDMRPVSTLQPRKVYEVFLSACRAENLHLHSPARWPFSDDRRGMEAVRRWFHGKKFEKPSAAALNELPLELAKSICADYRSLQHVHVPQRTITMAYTDTQLDEHHMDQQWAVMVPGSEEGEWTVLHTTRLWALVMIECSCSLALSGSIAFGPSFNTDDIKRLIHAALVPPARQSRLRLDHPDWRYREDAAYPGEREAYARNTWQRLAMDRHSTHQAAIEAIESVTGCEVVSGLPANPRSRDAIERFFQVLTNHADWFESAVGGRPDSPARRAPEQGAVASVIYAPLAQEYLDITLRNYNVTPQLALDGNSPLGRAAVLAAQGKLFRSPIGEFGPGNLYRLLPRQRATIKRRHSPTHGHLCIYLGYTCYIGPEFSACQELMFGSSLEVDVYLQEDARFAFVVPLAFPERVYQVVCTGRWAKQPHTFRERTLSMHCAKRKLWDDKATGPLMGVALARGLANAATKHEGLAMLVSGFVAFQDRFGAGVVPYIDLTAGDVERLLQFEAGENKGDVATDIEVGAAEAVNAAPTTGNVSPNDPFGLLSGK